MSPRDLIHRAESLTLAIRDHGGSGRPIILIHGAGANLFTWELVAPLLTQYGRVVAFDQRGHGWSEGTADYTPATLASDVGKVLDALRLKDPILVGHSWGATVAVEYAAIAACAGVVNVDGNVGSPTDVFAGTEVESPYLVAEVPPIQYWHESELAAMAEAQIARRTADGQRSMGELEVTTIERNLRRTADGRYWLRPPPADEVARRQAAWSHDLSARYREIRCPVLFVMSEETKLGASNERTPRACAAVLRRIDHLLDGRPDFRVRWMSCGHNIPLARPEQLAEAMRDVVGSAS